MAKRRFVMTERVSVQMALPMTRSLCAKNRQLAQKVAGKKMTRALGRPPRAVKSPTAITHAVRPKIGKKEVLHITLKLRRGLPSLRRTRTFHAIQQSFFRYSLGEGFRLTQFSVQGNHLHFIAEADSKLALSAAMQKLALSLSRRLNGLWKRVTGIWTGKIFKERYHEHALKSPLEVRRALLYVLQNGKKHGAVKSNERDFYSSAYFFDGFQKMKAKKAPEHLLADATAWLLTQAWRTLGLIRIDELPAH